MRLFGTDRVMSMMDTLGLDEDTPIDAKILTNAIENAQKQRGMPELPVAERTFWNTMTS